MVKYVIVGSNGLAKEIRFTLKQTYSQNDALFLGYIDNDLTKTIHNENVVGDDDWLISQEEDIMVIFGIGTPYIIKKLVEKYKQNNQLKFPNIIHPSTIADFNHIKMGVGNIITAGSILTTDIEIGDFNIINLNCTIGHDSIIGSYNLFNPSTNISGNVTIGDVCLFGTGSQVLEKLSIANKTIVGAGAVVNKSIEEPDGVYVGVPAKKIK